MKRTPVPRAPESAGACAYRLKKLGWLTEFLEALHRADQSGADAGLHRRMSGIGDHVVRGLRPGLMQLVGGSDRADEVVATLHHHRRNLPDFMNVCQEMVL